MREGRRKYRREKVNYRHLSQDVSHSSLGIEEDVRIGLLYSKR